MRRQNPYSLAFGRVPDQYISRPMLEEEVLGGFCANACTKQVYLICGIRGSGKTVFLTRCERTFREKDDWIVVDLNPNRNLLVSLVSKLSSVNELAELFRHDRINLSFFGFGLKTPDAAPITDLQTALARMLQSIQSQGKRVLAGIDEMSNTQTMREFLSAFQMLIRQKLPIFLLATGLYENVKDLQDEENLTFLYRAPKIEMGPLDADAIAESYQKSFGISCDEAREMSRLTRGYAFAFQLLGYLVWRNGTEYEEIISEYRCHLEGCVYEKIWSELSSEEHAAAEAIAVSQDGDASDICTKLGIAKDRFSLSCKKLVDRGVMVSEDGGHMRFALPLFEEFVRNQYEPES